MATPNSYTIKSLYLFDFVVCGSHSLFKLDISMPENEEDDWILSSPQVICHFDSDGDRVCRSFMGCGKLGSKLYILGGVITPNYSMRRKEEDVMENIDEFPVDVIVFDPAVDSIAVSENVSPMCFPKLNPVMFEANGKLYVLGSPIQIWYDCSVGTNNFFEEYNPETNEWKVLKSPVIKSCRSLQWGFCVVLDSSTVIIQEPFVDTALHIFNPKTYVWTTLELPVDILLHNPLVIDDCLYAAHRWGTFAKLGPICSSLDSDVHKLQFPPRKEALIDWARIDPTLFPELSLSLEALTPNNPRIFHLGDSRFCLLESEAFADDSSDFSQIDTDDDDEFIDDGPDCKTVYDVYIHKIVKHDEGDLKVKCLHAANFTVHGQTDRFISSFLI